MHNSDEKHEDALWTWEYLAYVMGVYIYGALAIFGVMLLALSTRNSMALILSILSAFWAYKAQHHLASTRTAPTLYTNLSVGFAIASAVVSVIVAMQAVAD